MKLMPSVCVRGFSMTTGAAFDELPMIRKSRTVQPLSDRYSVHEAMELRPARSLWLDPTNQDLKCPSAMNSALSFRAQERNVRRITQPNDDAGSPTYWSVNAGVK